MELARTVAEAILAASAEAIVATDREGVIRLWNPGAERTLGYRAQDAIGRSLDLIIPERLRARHWDGYRNVMETGRSRYGEGDVLSVPSIHRDGSRVSLEFTILPLKDEHGPIAGMAAVMRDVTRRYEELKSLRQKLAAAS
jgi:PAS domain S-box-containing protein